MGGEADTLGCKADSIRSMVEGVHKSASIAVDLQRIIMRRGNSTVVMRGSVGHSGNRSSSAGLDGWALRYTS
jgi:hypothetical protein